MIQKFENHVPVVPASCFVADNARIIGDVKLGENVNIWYGCMLRGDINSIAIGDNTNLQELSVVHGDLPSGDKFTGAAIIGKNVTVGHKALIHACTIGDNCLIGMGAIILSGATIGEGSVVAAGAVVKENDQIPPYSLAVGVPAKVKGPVHESMKEKIRLSAEGYVELARRHMIEAQKA